MAIETDSYVRNRDRIPGNAALDRAIRAEALAADAVRLVFGTASIIDGILALVERENVAFTNELRRELGLVRERIADLTQALHDEESRG